MTNIRLANGLLISVTHVEQLFKEKLEDSWPRFGWSEFFERFDFEEVFFRAVGCYQGDYIWVWKHTKKRPLIPDSVTWYFAVIGYGSCSGCDALQAMCDDISDYGNDPKLTVHQKAEKVAEFIELGHSKARKFDTLQELQAHVRERGNQVDWHWYEDEMKPAFEAILALK